MAEETTKTTVYDIVNDRISEAVKEQQRCPWHADWSKVKAPQWLMSEKEFRGINFWLTKIKEYDSPYWLSMPNQLNRLNGELKKGEKCSYATSWRSVTSKRGTSYLRPFYYKIVNVRQTEKIDYPEIKTSRRKRADILSDAVGMLQESKAEVDLVEGHKYNEKEMFTLFRVASENASHHIKNHTVEESMKEILSDLLCAGYLACQVGLDTSGIVAAGEAKALLNIIEEEEKTFMQAASLAQKKADYILGITWDN
jgi:antirestriction protein ArdC